MKHTDDTHDRGEYEKKMTTANGMTANCQKIGYMSLNFAIIVPGKAPDLAKHRIWIVCTNPSESHNALQHYV